MGNTCCALSRGNREWDEGPVARHPWEDLARLRGGRPRVPSTPQRPSQARAMPDRVVDARQTLREMLLGEGTKRGQQPGTALPRSFLHSFEHALSRCTVSFRPPGWPLRGRYYEGSDHIQLNERLRGRALLVTLFHEYAHAAGGTELDAEVLEHLVFGHGRGATSPSPADFREFREHGGRWFSWNSDTGAVRALDTGEEVVRWPLSPLT